MSGFRVIFRPCRMCDGTGEGPALGRRCMTCCGTGDIKEFVNAPDRPAPCPVELAEARNNREMAMLKGGCL